MAYAAVIVMAAAIFAAVILYLAVNQDKREKWIGMTFLISSTGGLCLYGAANAYGSGSMLADVFETVVDVGRMFAGINDVADFQEFAGENSPWMILFWLVHFLAYYSMASAILMVVAKGMLKRIRGWFLRINDVELIYGINDNSVSYGRNLSDGKRTSIVYVGNDVGGREADIRQMGGLIYSDKGALNPDDKLLKRLSVKRGKGKFRLSALSKDIDANYDYAVRMLECLKKAGIRPEQTEVVLFGREEHNGEHLQALGSKYGYGTVRVFDKAELVARLLLQKYPICDVVSFDQNAKATTDANILLVGFGRKGQEVLEKLVIHGQFEGSNFKVKVFDSNCKSIDGFYRLRFKSLLDNYDISFEPYDGRSREFAKYLRDNIGTINYIVVAVGDGKVGREICMNILEFMATVKENLPVYQCGSDSVQKYMNSCVTEKHDIYDTDILYSGSMDTLAMRINHHYCNNDASAKKNWAECSYFNRMSSRTSADYLSSLLRRIGADKNTELPSEVLDNLAKSEHLRWCAFHFACGYVRMDSNVLAERAQIYSDGEDIRITKDADAKLHACLVGWDELDELSEYESSVTGKSVDYKQKDRDNVLVVKELLA